MHCCMLASNWEQLVSPLKKTFAKAIPIRKEASCECVAGGVKGTLASLGICCLISHITTAFPLS